MTMASAKALFAFALSILIVPLAELLDDLICTRCGKSACTTNDDGYEDILGGYDGRNCIEANHTAYRSESGRKERNKPLECFVVTNRVFDEIHDPINDCRNGGYADKFQVRVIRSCSTNVER